MFILKTSGMKYQVMQCHIPEEKIPDPYSCIKSTNRHQFIFFIVVCEYNMNYNRTSHKEAYFYTKETNTFNMYYQWKILVCVCIHTWNRNSPLSVIILNLCVVVLVCFRWIVFSSSRTLLVMDSWRDGLRHMIFTYMLCGLTSTLVIYTTLADKTNDLLVSTKLHSVC